MGSQEMWQAEYWVQMKSSGGLLQKFGFIPPGWGAPKPVGRHPWAASALDPGVIQCLLEDLYG